ncbi:hypothetical protein H4582DRAFT_1091664 [Lactarius indigo]|nr:hypothetical protein H4582DRAFT_1091664 [Lactarius indigo]
MIPVLDRDPCLSGITAAVLGHVTMTLPDVQMHLRTLINTSTILLGRSFESDLHALQLAHPRYIGTATPSRYRDWYGLHSDALCRISGLVGAPRRGYTCVCRCT